MCKKLIKIAMDDLRDAGMLADYAKEAKGTEWEAFFANRLKQRMREFEEDKEWLHKAMGADKEHVEHYLEEYMDEAMDRIRWGMGMKV